MEGSVRAGCRNIPRKAEENYEECQSVLSFSLPALISCSFQTRNRHCTESSCCHSLVICGVAPDRAGQYSVCLRTARRDGRFPAAWFLSRFVPQVKTVPGDRPLCCPVCIRGYKELMEITCLRHGSDFI